MTTGNVSIKERYMDFVASVFRDRPQCNTCGTAMKYRNIGDRYAWVCPHSKDSAHVKPGEGYSDG